MEFLFVRSRFNISVLVAMDDKQRALQVLNDGLFEEHLKNRPEYGKALMMNKSFFYV